MNPVIKLRSLKTCIVMCLLTSPLLLQVRYASGQALNQTAPGVPSFATVMRDDYEAVNMADLGITVDIPIRSLSSIIPLNYHIVTQPRLIPAAYINVINTSGLASTWSINAAHTVGATDLGFSTALTWKYFKTATCPDGTQTIVWGDMSLVDQTGAVHPLDGNAVVDSSACLHPASVLATTVDGSGLSVNISYSLLLKAQAQCKTNGCSARSALVEAYDRAGRSFFSGYPVVTGSSGSDPSPHSRTTAGISDPNGNQIDVLSTDGALSRYFIIPRGATASRMYLSTSDDSWINTSLSPTFEPDGDAPRDIVFPAPASLASANGNSVSSTIFQLSTQQYATHFGCPLSADYVAPNSVYYVPTISLPNKTSVSFSYEATQGLSGQFTTGRFQSLTLPTGGTISYVYSGGTNGINCIDGTTNTLTRTTPDGISVYTHTPPAGLIHAVIDVGVTNGIATIDLRSPHTQPLQVGQTMTFQGLANATFLNGNTFVISSLSAATPSIYEANVDAVTITVACTCSDSAIQPQGAAFGYAADPTSATSVVTAKQNSSDYKFFGTYQLERDDYQGSGPSRTLLKQVVTCYNNNLTNCSTAPIVLPILQKDDFTTLAGGGTTRHEEQYDALGNKTFTADYDFNSKSGDQPLRSTRIAYGTFNGQQCVAIGNFINDRPCLIQTMDRLGNIAAQTTASYDVAGNLLSRSRVIDTSSGSGPQAPFVSETFAYDPNGIINTYTDPRGMATTYVNGACNNTLPTSTTAGGLTSSESWDCDGLVLASKTDPNGQITTIKHDDPEWRTTAILNPDGGSETATYSDFPLPPSITTKRTESTDGTAITTVTTVDGLGRPIAEVNQSAGTEIDTTYDADGLVYTVSNPGHIGGMAGVPVKTMFYDGLRRSTSEKEQDGGVLQWVYSGPSTTSMDEKGNAWIRTSDALGRLAEVVENAYIPSGGFSCGIVCTSTQITTDYQYDVLGDLKNVTQYGSQSQAAGLNGPISDVPRIRTFQYDALSRLVSATNPETGTICYGQWSNSQCTNGYDANGNLLHKTDARGITTNYTYDALNRLTTKQATGETATSYYAYDLPSLFFGPTPSDPTRNLTVSPANPRGRLVSAAIYHTADRSKISQYGFSYDAMGRMVNQWLATPSYNTGTALVSQTTASYDLAGNMIQLTYPDGSSTVQNFDSAGRLGSVTSGTIASPGPAYLSSITYNPDASPNVQSFGNNVQQTIVENSRLQVQSMVVASTSGGGPFASHAYCYSGCATGGSANNGNIWGITDNLNGAKTQGFTYDALNRISSFSIGGASNQQYAIDSFGNMSLAPGGSAVTTFDAATNRVNNLPCSTSTTPYDTAGNQLCDTDQYGGARQYQYDAESRPTQITTLGSSTPFEKYAYDASGNRVRKTNADGTYTEYIYFNGQPIAEKDQTGVWTDYIYANGKKIAKVNSQINAYRYFGNHVGWHMPFGVSTDLQNFSGISAAVGALRTGDTLSYDSRSANVGMSVYGGLYIYVDGTGTNLTSTAVAASSQFHYTDTSWHHLTFDLGGNIGHSLTGIGLNLSNATDWCNWEQDFANIVFTRADGTVIPILTSNQITTATYLGTLSDGSNQNAGGSEYLNGATEKVAAGDNAEATFYYLDDHLGSTQLEFTGGGRPVWKGEFTPFGQELDAATTAMHYKFTGKERDAESGLDYFGARYYGSSMGRFTSPDPTFLNIRRVFNPQRWNMYAYGLNNPLTNIDPDGNETIAVVYPNYQVAYHGDHTIGLGHGAVIIADKDGTTHYFEYGRYVGPDGKTDSNGLIREEPTPSVQRDASGNITPDSMNNLLKTVSSQSGKGGTTDALVVPTTSAEDANILAYLKAREAENGDPNRQKYSLFGGHNCGTLACESLQHGGVNVPGPLKGVFGDPYNNWLRLWAQFQNAPAYQYQPKEHVTVTIHFNDQIVP